VVPRSAANTPPLVHFNSWYALGDSVREVPLLRSVDLAAEAGAEAYILDSGWYNEQDWSAELGDYRVSRRKFPRGLEAVADHVRARGMTFGLWVEIENVGRGSRVLREHPDWCLSDGGRPLVRGGRCQLDFAKPEVRRWATATVERLVRDYGLGWIKIDYNVDIGDRFDPAPGGHAGGRLRDHLAAYYAWLDELRAAHPRLVVENCSSGALRFDLGIMAHAHTAWVSDVVSPEASPALRYGCTLQFAAALCNHWMVGENDRGEVKPGGAPGWWDYMFRVAMNGQFGLSGRLAEWEPALRARAAENVALYKRVRATVADGDVYHLTPPPRPVRPAGWMALQYAAPAGDRSVVMAYRLDGPAAADTAFRLRGLRPDAEYDVARDGRPVARLRGAALAAGGLPVALAEPWRAAVYELSAR
jgi:alpha-galactosidase